MRKLFIYCLLACLFTATTDRLHADVVTQNFESFATTTLNTDPGTRVSGGWAINEFHVQASPFAGSISSVSGTKIGFLPDQGNSGVSATNSYVESPLLGNGVGQISFYLQNVTSAGGSGPFICELQINTNGTWETYNTYDNSSNAGWVQYTETLNYYGEIRFRIFRDGSGTGDSSWLAVDEIATTEAPAKVEISDVTVTPAEPIQNDLVSVSAILTPSTLATNITAELLWSANGGSSNTIAMSYNGGTGRYETDYAITNQPAFTVMNYQVRVTFTGPTPLSPNSVSGSFFYRKAEAQSAYTSVSFQGGLTQTLELVSDETWNSVLNIGSPLGATDVFVETVNGSTMRWSDPAPIRTELPVFGALETNVVADIRVDSIPAGSLLLTFDEELGRYGIEQADYQSFNTWTGAGTFSNYSIDGWTLTRGRSTADAGLAYDSYSIQFESTTADRAIESPVLPNGIGTISFRYRNTETNGLSPAVFAIQTRATNTAPWSTAQTVTNIISPDYLYHSYTIASLDFRHIRIVSLNGTAAAQLLIDDIVITRPGATVQFQNLTHAPTNPTIEQTVDVSLDVTPLNGASIASNGVTLYFRGGTNGVYDPIIMTNTVGDTYTATIPRGATGEMQYYVEAVYLNPATGGYQTANDPLDRTGSPASYTNTNVTPGTQDFGGFADTDIGVDPGTRISGGWTINDVHIQTGPFAGVPSYAGSKLALLPDQGSSGVSATNSYIETPLFNNGVGKVAFHLQNVTSAGGLGPFTCELRISTNETDWVTVATYDNTGNSGWVSYTNNLEVYGPVRIRFFRDGSANNDLSWLAIDGISISYPPAYVTASGYDMHPAYPSEDEAISVYATIESATTHHPAFNIAGTIEYEVDGSGTWLEAPMERVNPFGSEYVGQIPGQPNLTQVEYRIRADFKGYNDGLEGSNQSPTTFTSTNFQYRVREFSATYERITATVGGVEVEDFQQLSDGQWEGVIRFVTPTSNPSFLLHGFGYYDGNTISGTPVSWGDSTQSGTNLPILGTASPGSGAITIPGDNLEGQFVIRFDENTLDYSIILAAYQDFENWPADNQFFGESYAAAQITQFTNSFETWAVNDPKIISENFDTDWPTEPYPDNWSINLGTLTVGTNRSYRIEGGIVVEQLLGAASLLIPAGFIRNINTADVKQDIGTLTFDMRAAKPYETLPAINSTLANNSIMITVDMKALDIPTNSTLNSIGYAYKSLIFNYIDDDNFYEARVAQTGLNTRRIELWKKVGGAYTATTPVRKKSFPTGSITEDDTFSIVLNRVTASELKMRMYRNNSSQDSEWRDTSALSPSPIFGLDSFDASVAVNNVKVYANTNDSTAYVSDPLAFLDEWTFESTPSDWDGRGIWQRNATDNTYERPGYTGNPIDVQISYSTDLVTWETISDITNITHSYYQTYAVDVRKPTDGFVRLQYFSGNPSEYILIDNLSIDAWRATNSVSIDGWNGSNVWVATIGNTNNGIKGIEMRASRVIGGTNENMFISSPTLAGGAAVVALEYRAAEDATGPVAFDIQYQKSGTATWFDLVSVSNTNAANWTSYAYGITDRAFALTIRRIRIRNTTPGADDGLRLDNIVVTAPPPVDNSTWWGYNILVTDQQPDSIIDNTQSPWRLPGIGNEFGAFLNNSTTNDTGGTTNDLYNYAFIQSAYMPDGIGEIRFRYRAWDTNSAVLQIVSSTNRTENQATWTLLDTITVSSNEWQEYRNFVFDRVNNYVGFRIDTTAPTSGRIALENILITAPVGAGLNLGNLQTIPEAPLYNETVHIQVDVTDRIFNPTDIQLVTRYKFGTDNWGNFSGASSRTMELIEDSNGGLTYKTIDPIPAINIADGVVQYQVVATFDGLFASQSSPQSYRSFLTPDFYYPLNLNRNQTNQIPYYFGLTSRPGQIFINEFNILDPHALWGSGTNNYMDQYIEIAGLPGLNIQDWKVEYIAPGTFVTNITYALPSFTFPGSTNFGFFVLGATNVTEQDMLLSPVITESGGIQLVRPIGIIDQQISFDIGVPTTGINMTNSPDHKFVYAGADDDFFDFDALSLTGTGNKPSDMSWTNTTYSIANTNDSQVLIPWPTGTNDPPVTNGYTGPAEITGYWSNGDRLYAELTTEANNLTPTPWYTTNLLASPIVWLTAPNPSNTVAGNVYTVSWDRVDEQKVFYTVTVTEQ